MFIVRDPGVVNQCKTVQNDVESVVIHDLGDFPRFCPPRLMAFFFLFRAN